MKSSTSQPARWLHTSFTGSPVGVFSPALTSNGRSNSRRASFLSGRFSSSTAPEELEERDQLFFYISCMSPENLKIPLCSIIPRSGWDFSPIHSFQMCLKSTLEQNLMSEMFSWNWNNDLPYCSHLNTEGVQLAFQFLVEQKLQVQNVKTALITFKKCYGELICVQIADVFPQVGV